MKYIFLMLLAVLPKFEESYKIKTIESDEFYRIKSIVDASVATKDKGKMLLDSFFAMYNISLKYCGIDTIKSESKTFKFLAKKYAFYHGDTPVSNSVFYFADLDLNSIKKYNKNEFVYFIKRSNSNKLIYFLKIGSVLGVLIDGKVQSQTDDLYCYKIDIMQ